MGAPASIAYQNRPSCDWPATALVAAAVLVLASCASKSNNYAGPAPRQDLAEYRQVAVSAQKVVQATLASLDRAVAQSPCPPPVTRAFSKDVQRLEVDSFRIRERAQAIRTRGAAYFEQWQEHLRSVKDPAARQLAEDRRDRLKEEFAHIRVTTEEAREAFKPFLAGLHRLRNGLETDPAAASTDAMKEVIRTTRENGRRLETSLDSILGELDAVAATLKPEKAARKD
jgi:hypothetical protein